jgi:hypothetical protein
MKVNFGETIIINQDQGKPCPGLFALSANSIEWIKCREKFHRQFHGNVSGFFYSHTEEDNSGRSIAAFVLKTEEIIRLSQRVEPSQFSRTNMRFAVWIQPSRFWRVCPVRMSFFSLILRAALSYKIEQDNYEAALYSDNLIRETREAIKRFLYGFTQFTGMNNDAGWVNIFKPKDVHEICRNLILPQDHRSETYYINGGSALWM